MVVHVKRIWFPYFLFPVFNLNHDIIIHTNFIHIAAANTVIDDVTI